METVPDPAPAPADAPLILHVDKVRLQIRLQQPGQGEDLKTGIYVRALNPQGKWGSEDLVDLDSESVVAFVRSRGPVTDFAVRLVLLLLGHDPTGV